jgi:hypothetical protein
MAHDPVLPSDRLAPMSRNRTVNFTAPRIDTPAEVGSAMTAILQAAADGEISRAEGAARVKAIENRLGRLERKATADALYYVWADASETEEQALARQFPDGLPDDCRAVVFLSFAKSTTAMQVECDASSDLRLLAPAGRA